MCSPRGGERDRDRFPRVTKCHGSSLLGSGGVSPWGCRFGDWGCGAAVAAWVGWAGGCWGGEACRACHAIMSPLSASPSFELINRASSLSETGGRAYVWGACGCGLPGMGRAVTGAGAAGLGGRRGGAPCGM